jgi:beta-glucosidase-like glycosyl hydrolase
MLSEHVAQLVSPGFKFGVDDPVEAEELVELGVGGFCLYGGRTEEVAELTARLRRKARSPLIFNADYEDGVASQCPGGTELPSNMGVGASGSEELARQKGLMTALESRALGVRWVLAPVVDLATEAENPIVNIRSFGSDPAEVGRLAKAYCGGLRAGGVLSCLKHFPGHGRSVLDSHLEMPSITASRAQLQQDLAPFKAAAGAADSLMTGHLSVPALEPDARLPFSLSSAVAREARAALSFDGLIATDALTMHAVSKNFDERQAAERALLGGSDILLVPSDPKKLVYHLMGRVEADPVLAAAAAAALKRWKRAQEKAGSGEPEPGSFALVGGPEHKAQAAKMAEACLAWAGGPACLAKTIRYAEPACAPEDWGGLAFVSELKALGADVRPADGPLKEGETLVLGCLLTPRAYTGRIRFDEEGEAAPAQALLSLAKAPVIVSFGSPFVFEAFRGWSAGLCSFSPNEAAQKAAARALLGRLNVTGRMPVRLSLR